MKRFYLFFSVLYIRMEICNSLNIKGIFMLVKISVAYKAKSCFFYVSENIQSVLYFHVILILDKMGKGFWNT